MSRSAILNEDLNLKMGPKRGFYPLVLIVSLSALFIFSLHRYSSLPLSSSPPMTQFPLTTTDLNIIQNPSLQTSPNFSFTIKVLTYDRLPSLSRCLRSLAAAHYDNEKVNIHIFIDHFKVLDQNDEYLDQKLNESRQILDFVDGFEWRFGEKMVHYRTGNVGLQAQWLEAWWPASDDEFAFVVEDDIELSPLYYRFLRGLIANYYYNASNYSPWIYGASLQRPRFVPGKHGNKISLDEGTQVFLYQLVGTWGQLLFPKPWKEFRLWYDIHKNKGMKPILDGMVTTGWYKKMGDKIWTPWFIKFIHSKTYFNIYTNFPHESALSVSHRDAGVNYGKTAGPDSNLLQQTSQISKFAPLKNLKWYDFCFQEVLPNRIVNKVHELEPVLKSTQKANTLVLVNIHKTPKTFIKNLLCHFERLNVRNYVFVGPDSEFLFDLSRRGHPVVNADRFLDDLKKYKSVKVQNEVFVTGYVVKKGLEMNYDMWVLDNDVVPVKPELFVDFLKLGLTVDFYVGKRFGILFAKSSGSGVWTERFVGEIAGMGGEGSFGILVGKVLEMKGVKFERVDEGFIVEVDESGSLLKNDTNVVFWSSKMGLDLVRNRLEGLGLWIIDGELNCKGVICHTS
ncbi:hypothetical protein L2E82_45119 [Cichorium intybus]|uniref:Uncharacterized protein n=1 Tax=Cichorium intybus TaxID=13427 RepID=A0ACB8ZS10_CICIN|nr:hypothetical protein L2E82_45119 [Cichorium intybus]